MFRKVFVLTVIVLVSVTCSAQAAVIDSNWIGGDFGSWETASNWNPPIVPDNSGDDTFNVIIDGDVNGTNIEINSNHDVNKITCYNEVMLGKWQHDYYVEISMSEPVGLMNYGVLELWSMGLPLQVIGNVVNANDLEINCDVYGDVKNINGGYLSMYKHRNIYGTLFNDPCSIIEVTYEDMDIEDSNLINYGLILAFDDGAFTEVNEFHNYAQIKLFIGEQHGINFYNHNGSIITGSGYIHAEQTLSNEGVVSSSKGCLSLAGEESIVNLGTIKSDVGSSLHLMQGSDIFSNLGQITINSNSSIALLSEKFTTMPVDCTLNNEPNGAISIHGGVLSAAKIVQKANADFSGFGGIAGNIVIDSNGIIELTGSTNIVGDVNILPDATLEISDGVTLVTGQTVCNGTIHMKGGYLIPQGGLSGNCNIIWEPGLFTNPADFNLDGKVNFGDFVYFAETWLWQTEWR